MADYKIKMKTAALHNLGCKVNEYETLKMRTMLSEAGFSIVDFSERADIYVINTCTVTAEADRKSRQMIRRARRLNEDALIIACGCFVQTASKENDDGLSGLGADILLGNNEKAGLLSVIEDYFENNGNHRGAELSKIIDINSGKASYEEFPENACGFSDAFGVTDQRTRAFLKIQDGCDRFCSYCLIPYARGRSRSRRPDDILNEADNAAAAGYREIVVTGIHIGSYSYCDGEDEKTLIDVLEALSGVDGIDRIRISSLEPVIMTESFVNRLSRIEKLCPHFHLSLQSGSDTVLSRMNRHYSCEDYMKAVDMLRERFDDPAITTDIICGFPGETKTEFEETLDFVRKAKFYEIHIFPYSKRQGTRAALLSGHIDRAEKERRCRVLSGEEERFTDEYLSRHIGKSAEILVEEEVKLQGKRFLTGFSKEYIRAVIPYDGEEDLRGHIVSGKFLRVGEPDKRGRMLIFSADLV